MKRFRSRAWPKAAPGRQVAALPARSRHPGVRSALCAREARRWLAADCGRQRRHRILTARLGDFMQGVTVVDHPLVQHKLTLMRDKQRSTKGFRELMHEIGMLLCYEVTRDLPLELTEIETPLVTMQAPVLAGKKLVFAPILRAGVGFLDGMLTLVPSARVAHVGLYRYPTPWQAVESYFKAPPGLADRTVLVLDPMLATANSAIAAIDRLKERGAKDLRMA